MMLAQIISFNCILKNSIGEIISTTYNKEVINSIEAEDVLLSGLARKLQNLKNGEKRSISLAANEAYGFYDPKKIILLPRSKFPREMEFVSGKYVSLTLKDGSLRTFKVIQNYGDMITLDGNHPLAGQDLVFEIETLDVRSATDKEINDSTNNVSKQYLN